MEQYSQYLMWVKNKNSIINSSFSSHSWEEEAFAEDARGPLGGFVWPPRSYSCSFCRREFRSAQALGGHMNVHRRERAKLKQSLINDNSQQNPRLILESTNPSLFRSPDSNSSRVSLTPVLGEEISVNICSNSDAKSCVCDEVLVGGHVETNLYLGFEVEEDMNCKRQKTVVSPMVMMGSIEDQVDLELRLARWWCDQYNRMRKKIVIEGIKYQGGGSLKNQSNVSSVIWHLNQRNISLLWPKLC